MALIELEEMEFRAHHGCFKEERIVGSSFLVNFSFEADTGKAEQSDNLEDTINYQNVYDLLKEEMDKPSHLLENVARRVLDKISGRFPSIKKSKIKISKLNPSLGGKIKSVNVTLEK
jgi:7,8-dihydroneopterin aldolase/epimerase/oxygenase